MVVADAIPGALVVEVSEEVADHRLVPPLLPGKVTHHRTEPGAAGARRTEDPNQFVGLEPTTIRQATATAQVPDRALHPPPGPLKTTLHVAGQFERSAIYGGRHTRSRLSVRTLVNPSKLNEPRRIVKPGARSVRSNGGGSCRIRAMNDPSPTPSSSGIPESAVGSLAADLLVDACGTGGSLQLESVRDLARTLGREFEALKDGPTTPDALASVAACSADLASLAACNLPHMAPDDIPKAAAATHLASGVARALVASVEATTGELEAPRGEYLIREARGAAWRAGLAARQVDESLEARAPKA